MSVILEVKFTPSPAQIEQPREERRAYAETFRALDGFSWKIWVSNAETGERGGIYLFADRPSAEAWGREATRRLTAAGATGLSLTSFEIDRELSAITLAPLSAARVPA